MHTQCSAPLSNACDNACPQDFGWINNWALDASTWCGDHYPGYEQAFAGSITAWSHDASSMIRPNAPCAFSCVDVKRDTVFHRLVDRTDFNSESILLLQSLCKVLCQGDVTATEVATPWRWILEPIRSTTHGGRNMFEYQHQWRAMLCHCTPGVTPRQKCHHWPHWGQDKATT